MSHPRWPGFDTKTGNPVVDTANRQHNIHAWKYAQATLRFRTPGGRKRKKQLTRVEGGNFVRLYFTVLNTIAKERARR